MDPVTAGFAITLVSAAFAPGALRIASRRRAMARDLPVLLAVAEAHDFRVRRFGLLRARTLSARGEWRRTPVTITHHHHFGLTNGFLPLLGRPRVVVEAPTAMGVSFRCADDRSSVLYSVGEELFHDLSMPMAVASGALPPKGAGHAMTDRVLASRSVSLTNAERELLDRWVGAGQGAILADRVALHAEAPLDRDGLTAMLDAAVALSGLRPSP